MKLYEVQGSAWDSPVYYVVADSFGQVEELWKRRRPYTEIKTITLISNRVEMPEDEDE